MISLAAIKAPTMPASRVAIVMMLPASGPP
jgi:hypothetical protein